MNHRCSAVRVPVSFFSLLPDTFRFTLVCLCVVVASNSSPLFLKSMFSQGSCKIKGREQLSRKDAVIWLDEARCQYFNFCDSDLNAIIGDLLTVGAIAANDVGTINELIAGVLSVTVQRLFADTCLVEKDQVSVKDDQVSVIRVNGCPALIFGKSEFKREYFPTVMMFGKIHAVMKQQFKLASIQRTGVEALNAKLLRSTYQHIIVPNMNGVSKKRRVGVCIRADVTTNLVKCKPLWARGTGVSVVIKTKDVHPLTCAASYLQSCIEADVSVGIVSVPHCDVPYAIGVMEKPFMVTLSKSLEKMSESVVEYPSSFACVVPFSMWAQNVDDSYFASTEPLAVKPFHVAFDGLWNLYYDEFVSGSQKSDGITSEGDLCPSHFSPTGVRPGDGLTLPLLTSFVNRSDCDTSSSDDGGDDEEREVTMPQTPDEVAMFAFCEAVRSVPLSAYPMPIPTFIAQYLQKHFPRLPKVTVSPKVADSPKEVAEEVVETPKKLSKKEEYELKKKEKIAAKSDKKKKPASDETEVCEGFEWKQTSFKKPLAFIKCACEKIGVLSVEKDKEIKFQKAKGMKSPSHSKLVKEHRLIYNEFLAIYHLPTIAIEELQEEQRKIEEGDNEVHGPVSFSVVTSVQTRYALSNGVPLDIRQHVASFSSCITRELEDDEEEIETDFSAEMLAARDSRFKLGCFPSHVIVSGVRDYLKKNGLIIQVKSSEFSAPAAAATKINMDALPTLPGADDTPSPSGPAWRQVMTRHDQETKVPEVVVEEDNSPLIPAVKVTDSIKVLVQGRVPPRFMGGGGTLVDIGVLLSLFCAPGESSSEGRGRSEGSKSVSLGKGLQLLIPANCISLGTKSANGVVDSSGGRRVMLQGKLPHVHVHHCFVNNRNMVLVAGLLAFGLSLSNIARNWRKSLACSVSVQIPTEVIENVGKRRNIRRERIRNKIDSKVAATTQGTIPEPFIQVSGLVDVDKMLANLGIPEHVIKVHNKKVPKKK